MPFDGSDFVKLIGGPSAGLILGWLGGKLRAVKELEDLRKEFENLKKGLQLDTDNHKNEVADKLSELNVRIRDLDATLDRTRESQADLAKEAKLAEFITEVQKQWSEMKGLIGELKGELRAMRQRRYDSDRPNR